MSFVTARTCKQVMFLNKKAFLHVSTYIGKNQNWLKIVLKQTKWFCGKSLRNCCQIFVFQEAKELKTLNRCWYLTLKNWRFQLKLMKKCYTNLLSLKIERIFRIDEFLTEKMKMIWHQVWKFPIVCISKRCDVLGQNWRHHRDQRPRFTLRPSIYPMQHMPYGNIRQHTAEMTFRDNWLWMTMKRSLFQ